jgi:amidase
MRYDEYASHDAVGLAKLVHDGAVTPRELTDVAIARLEEVNPVVHAVIHPLFERARKQAEDPALTGPFRGVPFLVKDLDGSLAGAPLNQGSRSLAGYIAKTDSELFARYQRAGLLIIGKTNTPEFGIMPVTEPELHGATRNPHNLKHAPGGSSGGSAAAVAAGVVPIAHAGDGGGSIRIPASCCGLFGLKPTRGRMPLGPEVGEGWNGFVVPHAVSLTVRDSAALLDATQGADVGAPYVAPPIAGPFVDEVGRDPGKLRIAFTPVSLFGKNTAPVCKQALDETVKLLVSLGHEVEPIDLDAVFDAHALRLAYLTIVAAGTAQAVADTEALTGKKPVWRDFEPSTWFLHQVGHAVSAASLEAARCRVFAASRNVARLFEPTGAGPSRSPGIDLLLTPTLAHPPVEVGEMSLRSFERVGLAALRRGAPSVVLEKALASLASRSFEKTANTMLFNMTGQPAMSVPLGWSSEPRLPIGMQFAGRFGDEATLFRLAGQLEKARPWRDQRPSLR